MEIVYYKKNMELRQNQIDAIQKLSFGLKCQTIEHFSHQILNQLETLYGPIPMHIYLRKCNVPIPGFTGNVGIKRKRNFPSP